MANAPAGDVVITGAAGRIGTCLRASLGAAGYRLRPTDIVRPADSGGEQFHCIDLADQDALANLMKGARAVVHLAGHPRDIDWPTMVERNYTGAYNAVRAACRAGVTSFIYASSNQAFGLHPADTILSADLLPRPVGLYGVSKAFGEAMLQSEAEAYGLTAFAWRICAFKPSPTTARDLRMWHSPGDAGRAVDACLRWTTPGFAAFWGVSANMRARVDDPVARRIGYVPQDNAEDHLEALQALGVNTDLVSEWPYLGGDKAVDWLATGSGSR